MGRGNGIKTVIPNISEVSLSLHRNPGEVNKFFGCELGAQTTYNEKDDRAVVNGSHTDAALQAMIHKCAACGSKEMVDMGHKLCTYILAQDKKAKKEKKKDKGDKKDKSDKKDKDDEKLKKKKKKKS